MSYLTALKSRKMLETHKKSVANIGDKPGTPHLEPEALREVLGWSKQHINHLLRVFEKADAFIGWESVDVPKRDDEISFYTALRKLIEPRGGLDQNYKIIHSQHSSSKDHNRYTVVERAIDRACDALIGAGIEEATITHTIRKHKIRDQESSFIQLVAKHGLHQHANFLIWIAQEAEKDSIAHTVESTMESLLEGLRSSDFYKELQAKPSIIFEKDAASAALVSDLRRLYEEANAELSKVALDSVSENLDKVERHIVELIVAVQGMAQANSPRRISDALVQLVEKLKECEALKHYLDPLLEQTDKQCSREIYDEVKNVSEVISSKLDQSKNLEHELEAIDQKIKSRTIAHEYASINELADDAGAKKGLKKNLEEDATGKLNALCTILEVEIPAGGSEHTTSPPEDESGLEISDTDRSLPGPSEPTNAPPTASQLPDANVEDYQTPPAEMDSGAVTGRSEQAVDIEESPDAAGAKKAQESLLDSLEQVKEGGALVTGIDEPIEAVSEKPDKKNFPDQVTQNLLAEKWDRAYWLSWAQNELGNKEWDHQIVKAFILGGFTEGGVKLEPAYLNAIGDIDQEVAQADLPHKLLTISALIPAVLYSVIKPHSIYQFEAILKTNLPSVDKLFDHVFAYTMHRGLVLATGLDSASQHDPGGLLQSLAEEAEEIMEARRRSMLNYVPAEKVAQALFRKKADLWRILDIIRRQAVNEAQRLKQFSQIDPSDLLSRSGEIGGVNLATRKKFSGPARSRLIHQINETLGIGNRWLASVQSDQPGLVAVSPDADQQSAFIHEFSNKFKRLEQDLEKRLTTPKDDAARSVFLIAARKLMNYMTSNDYVAIPPVDSQIMQIAAVELDETLSPVGDAAETLYTQLTQSQTPDIGTEHLADSVLKRQEFSRARRLVEREILPSEFAQKIDKSLAGIKQKFEGELLDIERRIEDVYLVGGFAGVQNEDETPKEDSEEHALNSGVDNRAQLLAEVENIRRRIDKLDEYPSAREVNTQLDALAGEVEEAEKKSHQLLEEAATALRDQWLKSKKNPEDIEYFEQEYQNSLDKNDIVAAWETVAQAQQLTPGDRLPQQNGLEARALKTFESELPALCEIVSLDQKNTAAIDSHFQQSAEKYRDAEYIRDEGVSTARRALKAVNNLLRGPAESETHLKNIFNCLGLRFTSIKRKKKLTGLACFFGEPSGRFSCPIPEFGSAIENGVDIVVVPNRGDGGHIFSQIADSGLDTSKSVLVVYPWPLDHQQRLKLRATALSRQTRLSPLVIDVCTLLYSCASSRPTSTFFNITLPFIKANPFIQAGGNVPVEMFVGRENERDDILQNTGSCIIYGGRQLGKSALLTNLASEYKNDKRHVIYSDIQALGQSDDDYHFATYSFWRTLADHLKSNKFCEFENSSSWRKNKPDEIADEVIRNIRETLKRKHSWELLVLLDETDKLLEADAKKDFRLVKKIRGLMEETDRRFKCVFAGLHSVQQYYGWTNHPFAQLGKDICIQPLPQEPAFRLVVDRMKSLGYEFDDRSSVLRILSQVNYHPGLIQIFCHKLVENIQRKKGVPDEEFVRKIEARNVREVENDREVMDHIRDRFDWTLSLDDRYKVLTFALILEGNSRNGYSVKEFHNFGRLHWDRVFGPMDPKAMRGLLEEMVGLGVLVNLGDKYALKSPNLLRLLGQKADISEQLGELVSRKQPQRDEPRNFRSRLDEKGHNFGPLTQGQASDLFADDSAFSITLIFGSNLNGLDRVSDQLDYIAESQAETSSTAWQRKTIPPEEWTTVGLLEKGLIRTLGKKGPPRRGVYAVIDMLPQSAVSSIQQEVVELAERMVGSFKQNRKGRLFILVGPGDALRWCSSDVEVSLPPRVASHFLQLWTRDAIGHVFEQSGGTPSRASVDTILDETSGHHLLVQEFFDLLLSKPQLNPSDIKQAVTDLKAKVAQSSSSNRDTAGLNALPAQLINVMAEWVGVSEAPKKKRAMILESEFLSMVIDEQGRDPSLADEKILEPWLQVMGHCLPTEDDGRLFMSKWVYKLYSANATEGTIT